MGRPHLPLACHPQQDARPAPTTRTNISTTRWIAKPNVTLILLALLNLTVPQRTNAAASEAVIKITRFQVPPQARPGELRRLACLYELQGATLHAMKLFKDDKEFYRYTPTEHKMAFPVPGVQVDVNRSSDRDVWLRISRPSAGRYKCQVSIEGTFNSVIEEKRMEVLDASAWQHQQQKSASPNGNRQQQASQRHAVQQQMTYNTLGGGHTAPSMSHQYSSSGAAPRLALSGAILAWVAPVLVVIVVGTLARCHKFCNGSSALGWRASGTTG